MSESMSMHAQLYENARARRAQQWLIVLRLDGTVESRPGCVGQWRQVECWRGDVDGHVEWRTRSEWNRWRKITGRKTVRFRWVRKKP